jgi:uncharacterized protein YkwD
MLGAGALALVLMVGVAAAASSDDAGPTPRVLVRSSTSAPSTSRETTTRETPTEKTTATSLASNTTLPPSTTPSTTAASAAPPQAAPPAGAIVDDIVNGHNQARANAGLPPLSVDPEMNVHAQFHADRLANAGASDPCTITHSSEIGTWYAGHYAGENIACVYPCPSNGALFMNRWMNSAPHRANILNGKYAFLGVGIACNGREMFAVAHFRS